MSVLFIQAKRAYGGSNNILWMLLDEQRHLIDFGYVGIG
jgi:hypothetical protein